MPLLLHVLLLTTTTTITITSLIPHTGTPYATTTTLTTFTFTTTAFIPHMETPYATTVTTTGTKGGREGGREENTEDDRKVPYFQRFLIFNGDSFFLKTGVGAGSIVITTTYDLNLKKDDALSTVSVRFTFQFFP